MVKSILATQVIDIPKDVQITVSSRLVIVKGPRGVLTKDFRHLKVDLRLVAKNKKLRAEQWFGDRRSLACIRTCVSHIQNMITGVTKGFEYKMRLVSAHFPINMTYENGGAQIRNFLGEKVVRDVKLPSGVEVSSLSKDEIVVKGNDIKSVSQAAANIHHSSRIHNKDIRKFLDGIYVSYTGTIEKDD